MHESQDNIMVINIISVSYSGSTWLNLMLGSHPDAFSVGEFKWAMKNGAAVCMVHGNDCPLWRQFRFPSDENPFHWLRRKTGKRIFIVNNSRKSLPHQDEPDIGSRFIHLIRDLRAVAASFLRKQPERKMGQTARLLAHDVRRNRRLIRRQHVENVAHLRYEDLAAEPSSQMEHVCSSLGIEYNASMLEFWNTAHHFLGGNRGALFKLLQQQGVDDQFAAQRVTAGEQYISNWDFDFYRRSTPSEFVDERWRSELTPGQLRTFRLFAGRINRQLGYSAGVSTSD